MHPPDFEAYGPWAALIAVSGLVGWAFRALLRAILKHLSLVTEVLRGMQSEMRYDHNAIREDIAAVAGPRMRRATGRVPV